MNAAIVKLVRAGAPQSWLWIEPDVFDLDELPECSPLRQAIEAKEAEHELRLARQQRLFDRLSRAWLGVKRICHDCFEHCFPMSWARR